VQAQIRVAAGEPLAFMQDDIKQHGHAIECRIYAEDASNNWAPSPGTLVCYEEPSGPWVRVDSGITEGGAVTVFYDPMIAKLITWGHDRADAIRRMKRALHEYRILGIQTSIPFFQALLDDEEFASGVYDTGYLTEEKMNKLTAEETSISEEVLVAMAIVQLERDLASKPADVQSSGSNWKWSHRLRR
jgi:acetyl/propionyl-CoA carboxylase alpha subunit